jgi:hypothetical protein
MSKINIPAAPLPSYAEATAAQKTRETDQPQHSQRTEPASKTLAPLDAAFLRRSYWSLALVGTLLTIAVAIWSRSLILSLSVAEGILMGGLLIKSQELVVRQVLQPLQSLPSTGMKSIMPLAVLLPLKYLALGGILIVLWQVQKINLIGFGFGFMTVQVVLLARLIGRVLHSRMRSVNEVYVHSGKSNAH